MITTTDTIVLVSSSIEKYAAPAIICRPTYNPETEICLVEVSVQAVVTSVYYHLKYFTFEFTKADIDAQSIAASGNVAKWMEAVEEKTKSYLEGLNPSATFTIS